jgi:hypothetical protein
MAINFEFIQEISAAVQEALNLTSSKAYPEYNLVYIRGLTRHNLAVSVKQFAKDDEWRLLIDANGLASKDHLVEEMLSELPTETGFVRNSSKRVQYEFRTHSIDDLIDAAQSLREFVDSFDLGVAKVVESRCGVVFAGTQFDRLKERGATISGMFGNLVCQASGMNLLMMQAEYYVDAGEIDGVEFAESGEVISIYECQSGIHKGVALDEIHLNKVLGSYLYDREVIPTVRKVVVLAGAYSDADLQLLRERAYELSRREQTIELVVLITTRTENKIGVERVSLV